MDIPVSRFTGYLKRMTLVGLPQLSQSVILDAYPGFWARDKNSEEAQRVIAKRLASLPGAESGRGHVWFNTRPNRRYSGGDLLADLPRGRYHTVANDPSGNDAGTLVAELSAYADPFRAGVVMARDLAFPLYLQDFREFVPDAHAKRSVAVSFFFWPDVESPFLAKLPNSARQSLPRVDQGLGWTMSFIEVPYLVEQVEIPNVVDLRQLRAQEWLIREWAPNNITFRMGSPPEKTATFARMLPGLLWPDRGGHDLTDWIGLYCQTHGVAAIVFPSARCNSRAFQKNRSLVGHMGWNLVDLRDVPPPLTVPKFEMAGDLPDQTVRGARVTYEPEGEWAGSWKVDGVVEFYHQYLTRLEEQFLAKAREKHH
jgi:hypothetical protein